MHEFALAEAVMTAACEEAGRAGIRTIRVIEVTVGQLQSIHRETFEFALQKVLPETDPRLADAEVRVEIEPARFDCRPCGRKFDLRESGGPEDEQQSEAIHFIPELAHSFLRCPYCGSPDFEVLQGRGVILRRIEGEAE